jgi:O-antigen ligase
VRETVRLPDGTTREVQLRNPGSVKGSIVFRKRAWSNALARIRRSPLLGIGFGPPSALFPDFQCEIFSSPLSNCGNAHNTYLTLAMRMGLPILALFGTASGMALWRGLRSVREATAATEGVSALMLLLASTVSLAAYGFMSLLLESPYLAVLFWTTLGGVAAWRTGAVRIQNEARHSQSPHAAAPGTRRI